MSTKIFVGNLDYNVTDDSLAKLFAEVGEVASANVITDRYSGRSKGFGFVEMSEEKDVKTAIEKFSGFELEGRPLTVNEARPREPRRDAPSGDALR